ncbi:heavy metal translocating P-type ATPase [Paragemmobacter ruber]|uniref:Heavy metal translocating P-type ATPase n=1 Tax=Paragemmobacter ruber TaxID=1985673 RepID=A0ABW9Y4F7_9RHOB|nr:cation-translocating P-type ATPase [Rhodobacter ruber]NBE07263.1 heavy metal translocating P-type ATPase [Rhodobacter ruber]
MSDHVSSDRLDATLTAVTLVGMATAVVDAFLLPLPPPAGAVALGAVYLAGGVPAAISALRALWRERILDIDLLMVVAALAAAAVGAALEGAVLLTLFSLSSTLEHRAMGKARRAVEALMELRPESAIRRLADGSTEEVAIAALSPGDVVILRPGARVPVDGTLIEGEGAVDESSITGESLPVRKGPGAPLSEATVNLNAVLALRVERGIAESTVARMIALVTEAQSMKAPSERFSAWFGQRYTVAVLLGSVLLFLLFIRLGWTIDDALYRAATVLVAASPCAVVISVPAAILSGLSAAARGGVLFKGGAALETLADVRAFAFDKTGTLTTGKAVVTAIRPVEGDEEALLSLAAGIEAQSEHPIAAAIRSAAAERSCTPRAIADVTAHPSEGITGHDAEGEVWAGNPRMAARMGADISLGSLSDLRDGAATVVYLGRGARLLGAITVADQPRETSRAGLDALRGAGIARLVMMTGDRRPVALAVGQRLGLRTEDIHADLLPGDKVRLVDALSRDGRVAFVGDGVNDAAALARADVGIAMGVAGSEVALQAAEVALLSDNMERLAAAHRLARRTVRIIRQNLFFALGAMLVLVIGGAFFDLPLPLAVIGHEGGTLLVVLNGLRLLADPIRSDRRN